MNTLLHNWNMIRCLRLGLAVALLMAGIHSGDTVAYVAAAFFGLQAVFNVGCCGAACTTDSRSAKTDDGANMVYEDVK